MNIKQPQRTNDQRFNSSTIKLHKSWQGTSKPQEKVLRLLRAEFIDLLKKILIDKSTTIKQREASIEIFEEDNPNEAFAYFDIYRDDNNDDLIHVSGFALQSLIDLLLINSNEIKERFAPHIPELKIIDKELKLSLDIKPTSTS